MVERGGRIRVTAIRPVRWLGTWSSTSCPGPNVYTDEAPHYWSLTKQGYQHSRVHYKQRVYVSGDVHTNTTEGFWSFLKRGISGVYHSVSAKYLQMYLDEYTFRYNHQRGGRALFALVTERAASVD